MRYRTLTGSDKRRIIEDEIEWLEKRHFEQTITEHSDPFEIGAIEDKLRTLHGALDELEHRAQNA